MYFGKKVFCFLVLAIGFHSALFAQMKQGSILVGGDISLTLQKSAGISPTVPNPVNNAFSFSPSIALAIGTNSFAGVRLAYGHSNTDQPNANETQNVKLNSFGGSFFLRQYKPLGGKFYFFADESIGANFRKTTYTQPGFNSNQKDMSISLGVYPGVAFNVTPHFQLETGLQNMFSISYFRETVRGTESYHTFQAATSLTQAFDNLYLGARFLFGN